MTDTDQLEKRVSELEAAFAAISLSDRYMISKTVQIQDGRSLQLGRSNGTRIGTATDQKVGFFGVSPVAQQSAISTPGGGSTVDTQSRGAIDSIINVLQRFGLIA